ncbi:unnamed protein product [Camellia sinensis]
MLLWQAPSLHPPIVLVNNGVSAGRQGSKRKADERTPHSKLSVQTSTRLDCDGARFGNWDVEASQFHEKHWMVDHHTSFVKPRMVTNNALIQDFDGTLVLVVDFPQEGPNTSDYAIFICFIIRQYVHRVEIDNTIDGLTQSVLRTMMVKMFMINPTRGRLRDI